MDGLRAFAVVAVIINHFNKDLLPSGYLGVDIFFVISGYVITSSLAGRESKNFLDFLTGFYERRIKRLVPALVVFVLITSVFICLFNPDPTLALRTGGTSLFGLSNLYLLRQSTDYFAQSTELNPFTHTWSLGVEEQFYLLFPFLIWFSGFGQQTAKGARNLFIWVGALTVASLISFIYLDQVNQPAAYFLMPPRFWEMAAGCLIFIGFQKRAKIEQSLEQVPPLLVVAAMVGVMFLPTEAAVPATISIVVLSAILVACLKKGTAAYDFFTLEKVVYVGLISYSLYLWHWGVLSISRWTIGIHWWSVPIQVGLMLLLAIGSYRWVETQFRGTNWLPNRWKTLSWGIGTSFAASGVILGLGRQLDSSLYLGNRTRIVNLDEISQAAQGTTLSIKSCSEYKSDSFANCSIKPTTPSGQRLLLIGDSHAAHYFPLLGWLRQQTGIGISGFVTSGQPFPPARYTSKEGRTKEQWEQNNSDSLKFFEKQFDLLQSGDILALSSRLEYYFIRSKFNLEHKGINLKLADNDWNAIEEDQALSAWLNEVRVIAKKSEAKGISVVLIAPIPVFRGNPKGGQLPEQLCAKEWFRPKILKECLGLFRQERSTLVSRLEKINREMDALAATNRNVQIYKPFDTLCPKRSDYCETYLKGVRTFRDDDHLSRDGSLLVASDFLDFASKTGLIRRQIQ
ncbi:acyltransferase [Cyanobium sp. WKJ7-Wakatipu]|uniref:acyltransferase family protein n=1 Tax=Cyanobium sp. WKJ7-Wakatipu TaxID=2823726 RepID=UPI0020CF4685|nr:acyltransferase family protein [Cyanobium sp. WKJ7-Wakatipu]MCP9783568.1 acyltransferase [Cyanobium sp. WKJ7-Wakatipu]